MAWSPFCLWPDTEENQAWWDCVSQKTVQEQHVPLLVYMYLLVVPNTVRICLSVLKFPMKNLIVVLMVELQLADFYSAGVAAAALAKGINLKPPSSREWDVAGCPIPSWKGQTMIQGCSFAAPGHQWWVRVGTEEARTHWAEPSRRLGRLGTSLWLQEELLPMGHRLVYAGEGDSCLVDLSMSC